tara:strand:- start:74 stop:1084 length:1011 start_codon:yes stop_codon:yes gene_type:complete
MAGMLGMQTAESILRDRQDATRKNTMGIIASNKKRDNTAAATSEKAAFDVAAAFTSFAKAKFSEGGQDSANLDIVRGAQDDTAAMQQSAIDAADAPRIGNSSYAGVQGGGYSDAIRQEAISQNQAYTEERIGMLPQDMQDAVYEQSYKEGITRDMLSDFNAMAEHAYKNKRYGDAMKFTNVGLAQTESKEKERMSFIRQMMANGMTTADEAAEKYKTLQNLGKAPEGSDVTNRPATNNASGTSYKSAEELMSGGQNSPEEEDMFVRAARMNSGSKRANDNQVKNYLQKNNIKGVKNKEDLEAIRTKASDELNQTDTTERNKRANFDSFKTWLSENL